MTTTRDEVLERIRSFLVEERDVDAGTVTEDSSFVEDLEADSLDLHELVMELEDILGGAWLTDAELASIKTVGDAIDVVLTHATRDPRPLSAPHAGSMEQS
jgi:acyl carrier protein